MEPVEHVVEQRARPAADRTRDMARSTRCSVDADDEQRERGRARERHTGAPPQSARSLRRTAIAANAAASTTTPPPSAPVQLEPTVTSASSPIATATHTRDRSIARITGASRSVSTWFVTP